MVGSGGRERFNLIDNHDAPCGKKARSILASGTHCHMGLYMGYAYALIVRKTGSLWGSVLAHAIADVIFMYIYFTLG